MFRLAGHLKMTVSELESKLSRDELVEWIAFEGIEPWGFDIENYRFGRVASFVGNMFSGPGSPTINASDVFPPFHEYDRKKMLMAKIDQTMMQYKGSQK